LQKKSIKLNIIDEEKMVSNFDTSGDADNKFIGEVLKVYVNDIPMMSKELEIAYGSRDSVKLRYIAHKLSGSLLNLGCEDLAELCQKIEISIKKNNFNEDISLVIGELKESTTILVTDLNKLKEKYPVSDKTH